MKKRTKKLVSLALAATMAAACGITAAAETAYSDIDGTIYWIGKMYEGDGWITMNKAAALAGEELGVEVITQTPEGGETDVPGEIALVENALDAGAAGIVLGVSDADAMIDICQRVKEADIPLVLVDSGLNSDDYDVFVAFDNYKCGVLLAEKIAEDLGGEGQVGIISAAVGSSTIAEREQGFLDTIANYENIEVVGEILYCDNDSARAMNQTYDMMTAYPDIKAFFTTNSIAMEGIAAALTELDNGVKVYGSDSSDAIVEFLEAGIVGGFTVASSVKMGYLSTVICAKLIKGEDVSEIEWNNETFTIDGKDFDTGSVLVDLENYQDPSIAFNVHPYDFFDTYEGWQW